MTSVCTCLSVTAQSCVVGACACLNSIEGTTAGVEQYLNRVGDTIKCPVDPDNNNESHAEHQSDDPSSLYLEALIEVLILPIALQQLKHHRPRPQHGCNSQR